MGTHLGLLLCVCGSLWEKYPKRLKVQFVVFVSFFRFLLPLSFLSKQNWCFAFRVVFSIPEQFDLILCVDESNPDVRRSLLTVKLFAAKRSLV